MTFLPIVERELRVAARKKGTYLARFAVGLGAMVLCGIAGLTALLNPSVRFGTLFFQTLSGLAMAYCLGAGRFLTADCLSGEKREGTMGLLFLTDLKGYDVVLGKLAATSLNGLYGLLAVLPVLALTLLTGGVTYGEFCRVALVLLDTFFFSLAIGVFASALTREFWAAMALNFYVLLALAGALPALAGLQWFFHRSHPPAQDWFLPCPVYTLLLAFDATYKLDAARFWSSASLILAMSWLLVALACGIAPRSWQDKAAARAKPVSRQKHALRSRARAIRNRLLDQNAYYWLAARPRWKAHTVWAVIGLALLWLVSMRLSIGWLDESICVAAALMLNATFKLWIILEAGQRLAKDAKSGAFELLLSTPLAAREIVRGQILALRRQFLKLLLAVAAIELFCMGALMAGPAYHRGFSTGCVFCAWAAGLLMLAADAATLSLVGMETALTEQNQARASVKTAGRVLALPWLLWGCMAAIVEAWTYLFPDAGFISWKFFVGSWFGIGMALDFLFARTAWRRLTGSFRELALRRYGPAPARESLGSRCMKTGRAIRDNMWRHPRNRKWAAGLAAMLVIGCLLAVWESNRSHDPPPEIVLTGPSDGTTLQAIAAWPGVFLVLPDGSLWRWGLTDRTNRAALPERVGTNRDWKMVSVTGQQRLGVRRDGSLWEWQHNGPFSQVGVDHDWLEAVGGPAYKVARKKDGTLWAWGDVALSNAPPSSPPVWIPSPTATNHAWKAQQTIHDTSLRWFPNATIPQRVVIYQALGGGAGGITTSRLSPGFYDLAVDSDGTLWMWGAVWLASFPTNISASLTNWVNYYPNPIQVCRETNWVGFVAGRPQNKLGQTWDLFAAPPNAAESITSIGNLFHSQTPVQVGTNRDWTAVEWTWNAVLAVRSDGSLWGWGDYQGQVNGAFTIIHYAQPTQLCAESNWLGFDRSFGLLLARNNAGALWLLQGLGTSPPDATAPASSIGTLFVQAAASNGTSQSINPFRAGLSRYQAHTNGTLWVSPIVSSGQGGTTGVIREAEQAGTWTNWLAVANLHSVSFGLTADGTLWTWGWNLGAAPRVDTRSRFEVAKMRAAAALGMRSPSQWTPSSATPAYPIQEKPRPLMKLVPEQEK